MLDYNHSDGILPLTIANYPLKNVASINVVPFFQHTSAHAFSSAV